MTAAANGMHTRARSDIVVLLVAVLIVVSATPGGNVSVARAGVLASDDFSRTLSAGWGSAGIGGSYTRLGTAGDFGVDGSMGSMRLGAQGVTRAMTLGAVAARDVGILVSVTGDAAVTGNGMFMYADARWDANSTQYRAKLRVAANGSVYLQAARVVSGSQSGIGSEVLVPGLTYALDVPIWLRAQFSGADPTTIQLRAWSGSTEPGSWTYTATDSTASLQDPGAVGLRGYLGSTATAPMILSWDDLAVTDTVSGTPPTASFSTAQQVGELTLNFTDTSTGSPTTWAWDFDDGATSTEQHPSHPYALAGTYSVTMTASNDLGSDVATQQVVVEVPSAGPLMSDHFERTISGGWGSADIGGPYSLNGGASSFRVESGAGQLTLPTPGATRGVWLPTVSEADVDFRFQVSLDRAVTGSGAWVYALARRLDQTNAYRPKVRFANDGSVWLHASSYVGGIESSLAPQRLVSGLAVGPGQPIWVRVSVSGFEPTMIRVKAWLVGGTEPPDWGFSVTDTTPALQAAGAIGLQAYTSSNTVGSQTVRFDGLTGDSIPASPPVAPATLVGAGDIAGCAWTADEETATLLDSIAGTIFAAGDLVYPDGTVEEFSDCYGPSWGRHRSRTLPVPGNHEYHTAGAAGYFGYWGDAAGDPAKGYYALNLGAWRVYVLNSECSHIGGCGAGSLQESWLRSDLAANLTDCTVAILHRPRFSSGAHGNDPSVHGLWQALYDARTELVISGHDHNYERFAPQTPTEVASARGVTEFVVGTGGVGLRPLGTPRPNSLVRQASSHGVLSLTLDDDSYRWQFVQSDGPAFTDDGTASCF